MQKMKKTKRLLSFLLAVVLVLTMLPMTAIPVKAAVDTEEFILEVTVEDNDTFTIPTSGVLNNNLGHAYDWNIDWGTGDATEHVSGTGMSAGIAHSYSTGGTYTITITPANSKDAWLAAFGVSANGTGASKSDNLKKITKVDSQLTPLMTRTATQINNGTAPSSYEWYNTFSNCINLTMGSNFKFSDSWNNITTVGHNFAGSMFEGCSGAKFTMGSAFNLPTGITTVGGLFVNKMFSKCTGDSFTMNSTFSFPAGITTVGANFATSMFEGCSGADFTMNSAFNLPTGITTVGDYFAYCMFSGCSGANFTMGNAFNLPTSITTVGESFAYNMFKGCSGANFTMNSTIKFPTGITTAGDYFAYSMFNGCSGADFTMGSVFNLPTSIKTVGINFAYSMFKGCSGANFTMGSAFTLPTSITTVGNNFAYSMFDSCSGSSFTIGNSFNFPTGIVTVGNHFAYTMFKDCSGANFKMNSTLNLPTSITTVGNSFAGSMFNGCSGTNFTMGSAFNLPTGITTVGTNFADSMFYRCTGAAFQVNDVFKFPKLAQAEIDKGSVYSNTFSYLGKATTQKRTATSIINGNSTPTAGKKTFDSSGCFSDLATVHKNWGGSADDSGITFSGKNLKSGTVGIAYSDNVTSATGGTSPYTYAITSGTLPAGLSLSSAGVFSGTPTESTDGEVSVTITATDSTTGTAKTATATYKITINKGSTTNAQTPTIATQPKSLSATVGETKALNVAATVSDSGTLSYQWYVNTSAKNTGGIAISDAISGATNANYTLPTTKAGTYYYYVEVKNTNNSVNGTKTATVTSNVATVTVTAKPETKTFTVTYKANGGGTVSGMPADTTKYTSGKTVTVKGTPVSTSKFFAEWNSKADGSGKSYTAKNTFKITGNTTLYAQWKSTYTDSSKLKYKVTGKKEVACIGTTDKKATSITIGNSFAYQGITYKVTSIAKSAFKASTKVKKVTIGNNIKTIGESAFLKCSSLETVTIGTGLTEIKTHAFCYDKKIKTFTIKSKALKKIGTPHTFNQMKATIKVPSSKLKAYKSLFTKQSGCSGITFKKF